VNDDLAMHTGLDAPSRLVPLVRAGSAQHREPLVGHGHERSRPAYRNRRSRGVHAPNLGDRSGAMEGSNPTRRDGALDARIDTRVQRAAPQAAAWGARASQ
jgi:hypothetical protein